MLNAALKKIFKPTFERKTLEMSTSTTRIENSNLIFPISKHPVTCSVLNEGMTGTEFYFVP